MYNATKRRWNIHLRFYFLITILIVLLSGCVDQTDIDKAAKLDKPADTLPTEILYNVQLKYSERGIIKFVVSGPEAHNFSETRILVFPLGFKVDFFDTDMSVKTSLSANYGINYEAEKRMEAKDSVVLTNYEKQETLNSEHILWNQNTHVIYSNVPVTITTPNEIIHGSQGFQSDEEFNNWIIKKPSGNFTIREDKQNEDELNDD